MGATKNLVLGGSGLIGSALCQHLTELGQEVVNIDIKEGAEFDIRTMDLMQYKDADFVWFLAWDVGGAKFLHAKENLFNIIRNNTIICEKVFSFLHTTGIPFLFASTQMADTNNTYGVTKLLGEEWTRLLGGTIARFWNVYGWEVPNERSHVIPDLVVKALETGKIDLMTEGTERRQFVHINDCAKNLVRIKNADELDADLTTGEWISILGLANMIAEKTGAIVQPGTERGFENILEPTKIINSIQFDISLEQGINELIEEGKKHLSTKSH